MGPIHFTIIGLIFIVAGAFGISSPQHGELLEKIVLFCLGVFVFSLLSFILWLLATKLKKNYWHTKEGKNDLKAYQNKTGFNHWQEILDMGYQHISNNYATNPNGQSYFFHPDCPGKKFRPVSGKMVEFNETDSIPV